MQFQRKLSLTEVAIRAWLTAAMHIDGLRADPGAYLTATKWRLLGKRLRARGQFASLLGRSSSAYRRWMLSEIRREQSPHDQLHPIVALVDARTNQGALHATLQSLGAEGIPALVISNDQPSTHAGVVDSINWHDKPWILPMQAGDRLALGAAASYRTEIGVANSRVLYADDDLLGKREKRTLPHFKPDWNLELYSHFDYLNGACLVQARKEELIKALSHKDWMTHLAAMLLANGERAHHVHGILHHRLARPVPPLKARPLVIADILPSVSIIVPTRNRVDLLRTCLAGIAKTDYPSIELIVIDNDSNDPETLAFLAAQDPDQVKVLRHPGPFNFSTINNRAAAEARCDFLCLLNNDIEVVSDDWLKIMITQALRDEVGAVGAQLLYPDGRIQHAGVVTGVHGAAGHAHSLIHPTDEGYFRRHALPQFVSAVTAACLVVNRDRFLAVGGFDEHNFPVAFNDVDLCLRLNQYGWQSLYEPRASLIHHESVSRGFDKDPIGAARLARELAALRRIWKTDRTVDPFHNPFLSQTTPQFVIAQ